MDRPISFNAPIQMKYQMDKEGAIANGHHIMANLPMDVLLLAISRIGIKDTLHLSVTCKYLHQRMNSPAIWEHVFKMNFKKLFPSEIPTPVSGQKLEPDYLLACKKRYEVSKSVDVCVKTVPKDRELLHTPQVFTYKNTMGIENSKGIDFFHKQTLKQIGSYKYDELIPYGIKFLQKDGKIYITRIMDQGRVDAIDMGNNLKVTTYPGLNNNYTLARCQINSHPFVSNGYLFALAQHTLKMWNLETHKLEQEFILNPLDHILAVEFVGSNDQPLHVPCVKIVSIDTQNNLNKTKIILADNKQTKSFISHMGINPQNIDDQSFMNGNLIAIKSGASWFVFLGDERIYEDEQIVGLDLFGDYLTTLSHKGQVEVLNISNNTVESEFSLKCKITKASVKSLCLGILSIATLGSMQVGKGEDLTVDYNNFSLWGQFTGECISNDGHLHNFFQSKVLRDLGTCIYSSAENNKDKTQTLTVADLNPRISNAPQPQPITTKSSGNIFSRAKKIAQQIIPI